jgi:hypothetical protein
VWTVWIWAAEVRLLGRDLIDFELSSVSPPPPPPAPEIGVIAVPFGFSGSGNGLIEVADDCGEGRGVSAAFKGDEEPAFGRRAGSRHN